MREEHDSWGLLANLKGLRNLSGFFSCLRVVNHVLQRILCNR